MKKIVAITSCPVGIAHTYMAAENLEKAGKELGVQVIVETHGRHDPCVGIRATPIAEAMLALVLIDHALRHRAQNTDVCCTTPKIPGKTMTHYQSPNIQAPIKEDPEPEEDV